jgi:hypothetical protein
MFEDLPRVPSENDPDEKDLENERRCWIGQQERLGPDKSSSLKYSMLTRK